MSYKEYYQDQINKITTLRQCKLIGDLKLRDDFSDSPQSAQTNWPSLNVESIPVIIEALQNRLAEIKAQVTQIESSEVEND